MPNRLFDWHEHIKDIEGEYRAARFAVERLKAAVVATPDILKNDDRGARTSRARRTVTSKGHTWSASSQRSRRRSARTTGRGTMT